MTRNPDNRLGECISPYLLEHADNPVAWQPWDAQALAAAREADRPILLSIGYSACHWCHVMARESFEDPATAELMNRLFVNIKVDREERPDLDGVYQLAHQALTGGRGGWPLTVFLTPDDLMPFFAGTYFPREPRHGMPPFAEVLERVAEAWDEQREQVRNQNARLTRIFATVDREIAPAPLDEAPLTAAMPAIERAFDPHHGGFGGAPKFPHSGPLALALERWYHGDNAERAREVVERTLEAMAHGGILDQIGGGLARYSVDVAWQIPHFEKMLNDNAALLPVYADASAAFERPDFADTARAIADWALREMRCAGGCFAASLDADSEAGEGGFYCWERVEAETVIGSDDWPLAARYWGFDRGPNFEGRWHPVVAADIETLAREQGTDPAAARVRIERARSALFESRERRSRPARDDKILTGWNAAMAAGLVRAGRRLDESRYIEAAGATIDGLRERLWSEGRLYAVWRGGERHQPAFLDDHAALLLALLELLQARWRDSDLDWARTLAEALLERFEHREGGGFHLTAVDGETLPYRPRPFADEAMPAGNALAALGLQALGELMGEPRYLDAAQRTVAAGMNAMQRDPLGHATLIRALTRQFMPDAIVLLTGPPGETGAIARRFGRDYLPDIRLHAIPAGAGDALAALPPASPGEVAALRCRGGTCSAPAVGPRAVEELIGGS